MAGTGADELQAVRADMLAIMARIGESVASVDGQASTLDHSLNALTPHLDRVAGVDGLIADLGRETSRMLAVNSRLRQRLDRSTEEMDDLRRELERARAEARIDPLTGLANRAGFDQAMGRAISESAASGEAFCVLLLDIDRFKSINDTHGHLLGDKVIRVIADIIRQMVRGGDTAGRLGGDEFAVILPNTPLNGAAIVGEKIRSAMAQARIRRVDNQSSLGKVTLSIGVAGLRAGETITDLVERADAALYQAKRRGRNRVCTEAETG